MKSQRIFTPPGFLLWIPGGVFSDSNTFQVQIPIKKKAEIPTFLQEFPLFISYSILVSVHTSHFIDVKLICRGEIEFDRKLYIIRKRLLL